MNTFPTGPSSAPPAPRRDESAARPDNAGDRQRVRDFERLLREKASKHDEDDDTLPDAGASAAASPFLFAPVPLPAKRSGGDGDGDAGRAGLDAAAGGATRAAMQASLDADPGLAQPLAPAANAAGAWEVTLRQPLGAAMDVRATRNADAVNGWSLRPITASESDQAWIDHLVGTRPAVTMVPYPISSNYFSSQQRWRWNG